MVRFLRYGQVGTLAPTLTSSKEYHMNVARTVAFALAAALSVLSAPASAVIFGSNFDPPDFFGTATFDVSNGCLSSNGIHNNDHDTCTVTWLTAVLTFRETPATAHTLTFSFGTPILPSGSAVFDVLAQGGELAGVDSAIIGAVTTSGDPNPTFNGSWYISFATPSAILFGTDAVSSFAPNLGNVFLYRQVCDDGCRPGPVVETATVDSFFRIPEPATLTLLLAALGCGWVSRRKRML
jgi:hypothetical protein